MSESRTVLEAIALRKHVTASYNRVRMRLAPHILYTRNDALYIDALTVEKGGVRPRNPKVATFKLDGLSGLALHDEQFDPAPVFNPFDPKYVGNTLLMVAR